jgi:hypothetical protein
MSPDSITKTGSIPGLRHEQRARGDAEHQIGDLKPARRRKRPLPADQRELDGDRRHQREGAKVMEEGEQRGQARAPVS